MPLKQDVEMQEVEGPPPPPQKLSSSQVARNQFKALMLKTMRLQGRQYKANICLISFPIALTVLMIVFQVIVDGVIQRQAGEFQPAVRRPSVTPPNFMCVQNGSIVFFSNSNQSRGLRVPFSSLDCDDVFENDRETVDTTKGIIYYGGVPVGDYPGVPKDATALALLPDDFVEPNAANGTGLLGNATTPLASFFGIYAEVSRSGRPRSADTCFRSPKLIYPILEQRLDQQDIDNAYYTNWTRNSIGGFDFNQFDSSSGVVNFAVYYNYTVNRGNDIPTLINFVSNAVWKYFIGGSAESQLANAGKMSYPQNKFMIAPVMQTLVSEKESKLREIMKMMGTRVSMYYITQYLFFYCFYVILSAVTVCAGLACGFAIWSKNNPGTYIILLLLWGHTLIAMGFFLSVFFTKGRTGTVVAYSVVLATGLLGQNLIREYFINDNTPPTVVFVASIIPSFAFYRGLSMLGLAVQDFGTGMTMAEVSHPDYRMDEVYGFLVVQWAVLLILGLYFDNVLPIGPGVKKHPLLFLSKCCSRRAKTEVDQRAHDEPDDVAAERARTEDPSSESAVRIVDLRKVFPSSGGGKKVAVDNLSMSIDFGECFGFLGPNGAGKSTTINTICGYLRPSGGNAYFNGLSLSEHVDQIHRSMGVCPQEDILWSDLTGPEHLEFFGMLKNLSGDDLKKQVDFWLEQVNLASAKTRVKYSREYSGGMKRRLSVAIALIGNPTVVLLDEPTTGLDPASRHSLWKVITNYRAKCSMLLTTHSMEEAEALCNRLGIFVSGRLKTVGASAELKKKYGQFFKILITTPKGDEEKAHRFLEELAPNIRLINSLAGTNSYEVSREDIRLSRLFTAIEANRKRLGILDWGVSNTSSSFIIWLVAGVISLTTNAALEEVFLRITEKEAQDEALIFAQKRNAKRCCGSKQNAVEGDEVSDDESNVLGHSPALAGDATDTGSDNSDTDTDSEESSE